MDVLSPKPEPSASVSTESVMATNLSFSQHHDPPNNDVNSYFLSEAPITKLLCNFRPTYLSLLNAAMSLFYKNLSNRDEQKQQIVIQKI